MTTHRTPVTPPDDEWLRTTDVARILKLDPATVRRMIVAGQIPATRPGRGYRVSRTALDAFLTRRTSTPISLPPTTHVLGACDDLTASRCVHGRSPASRYQNPCPTARTGVTDDAGVDA